MAKTVASAYVNRKGERRVQVSFDEYWLEDGNVQHLMSEIVMALMTARIPVAGQLAGRVPA